MESKTSPGKVTFGELQTRLIQSVNRRIQNGEYTERGLARILGISQPQVHNVLKGARKLKPELADSFLKKLDLDLMDLLVNTELTNEISRRQAVCGECPNRPVQLFGSQLAAPQNTPVLELTRKPPTLERRISFPFHKQAS